MEANDILGIEDLTEKIKKLKERATPLPDANALLKDWDHEKHDVTDDTIRPKRKVQIEEEKRDAMGRVTQQARYDWVEVNRITLPIEQDIVNIHTAFTLGTEPRLTSNAETEGEKTVFSVLKSILKGNKIKYHNKRVMRSWLSEKEAAEYWYKVEDKSWWAKVLRLFKIKANGPANKLKVALWSPFRGDKLYPIFNEQNDLILFTREYKTKDDEGKEYTKYMIIDNTNVIYVTEKDGNLVEEKPIKHGFEKMPVMYIHRDKPFCEKIRRIRDRLETLMSNYADCIDYNFAPKLAAKGTVEGIQNRGTSSEIILLEKEAEIGYLSWQQSSETAKFEFDSLTEKCYSLTNTPRISFENLQGLGNSFSGVSFEFAFMGAHMAVHIHAEDMEEYLQRRVNFLLSAIGSVAPKMKDDASSIDVEVEIIPFIIKNKKDNVDLATAAVAGKIASRKSGIILAGLTDAVEEELAQIEEDESKSVVQ